MADELKDQRVVTMMSPSELEAIDDWMFKNRIRSRGEAIRRLCQMGMSLDRRAVEMLKFMASSAIQQDHTRARELLHEVAESAPPDAQGKLYEAITVMADFERHVLVNLYKGMLETWPIKTGLPMAEAAKARKDFETKIDGLSPEEAPSEIVRMINILSGKEKPEG